MSTRTHTVIDTHPVIINSGAEGAANDDGRARKKGPSRPVQLARTFEWILSVERERWGVTWEGIWHGYDSCPQSGARLVLAEMATRWLGERVHGARWSRVWCLMMDHADAWPEHLDTVALLRAALRWLPANKTHAYWSVVRAKVLEHQEGLPPGELDARALDNAGVRPSAYSFDATRGRGAPPFAAPPRSRCSDATWRRLLAASATRGPMRGRVVDAVDTGYLVDIGVTVFVASKAVWLQPGEEVEVRGVVVDRVSGAVRADALKPTHAAPDESVVVGRDEHGCVEGTTEYGLFVYFRGFCGMLHHTDMPEGDAPSRYAVGQRLRVTVLAVSGDRISLALARCAARVAA